ncbi:hypothetical protein V8E36_009817 [Tilletia maclaganii]
MDNLTSTYQSLGLGGGQGSSSSPPLTAEQQAQQQSAAARFERFFATSSGDPTSPSSLSPGSPSHQGKLGGAGSGAGGAATISAGSGAAHNLSANGAFASFHLGPHGAGGPQHHATIGPGSGPTLGSRISRSALPNWNNASNGGSAGGGTPNAAQGGNAGCDPGAGGLDDDIIPNAIVVKNIRFDVKREQLLAIMEELSLPIPYAFNYHFDQGVFRGLAFANFRTAEDADQVVAALNGFDVMGRKLRVEYKKVLQAGEKERIEKEKAIKRMQSMQMEKDRRRMQEEYAMAAAAAAAGMPPPPPSAMIGMPYGAAGGVPPVNAIPGFHTDASGGAGGWDPHHQQQQHLHHHPPPPQAAGLAYPSDAASATSPTLSSASGGQAPLSLASTVRSTYTADAFRNVPLAHPADPSGSLSSTSPSAAAAAAADNKYAGGLGQNHHIGTTQTSSLAASASSPSLSAASTSGLNAAGSGGGAGSTAAGSNSTATPGGGAGSSSTSGGGGAPTKRGEELDLNDPATLEIYSRVLLFRDDRMRDELSFSRNLSPLERRTVHLVAQKLDLYHYSMGEGEERYVIVTKNEVAQPSRSLRSQASTIGRSNRDAYTAALRNNSGSPNGGGHSGAGANNGMLYPHATTGRASAAHLLRMKKSAPDMKRYENSAGHIGGGLGSGAGFGGGGPVPSLPGSGGWGAVGSNSFGPSTSSSHQQHAGSRALGSGLGGSSALLTPGGGGGGGGGASSSLLGSDLFGGGGGGGSHASSLAGRRSNINLREGYAATVGRNHFGGGLDGSGLGGGGLGSGGGLGGGAAAGGNSGLAYGTVSGGGSDFRSAGGGGSSSRAAAGLANLFSSPFDVPPVPTLGNGNVTMDPPLREREGSGSNSAGAGAAGAVRQPRGPPASGAGDGGAGGGGGGSRANFAMRSRVTVPARSSGGAGGGGLLQGGEERGGGSGSYGAGGGGQGQGQHGDVGQIDAQTHSPLEI